RGELPQKDLSEDAARTMSERQYDEDELQRFEDSLKLAHKFLRIVNEQRVEVPVIIETCIYMLSKIHVRAEPENRMAVRYYVLDALARLWKEVSEAAGLDKNANIQ